jgi:fumarate hydratase subunit beta
MIRLETPLTVEQTDSMQIGDQFEIFGRVLCGRDAVLPRIIRCIRKGDPGVEKLELNGAVIFHTAVSPAGIGPTTSNKAEIEESIPELAAAGVRIHLGKGSLGSETIKNLAANHSIFAVTPPVTALFSHRITATEVLAYPEEGMEALFAIQVEGLPGIVAAAHGRNIFNK